MADEKKTVKKEDTSKAKVNPISAVAKFFAKIGKAIAKFFKDLKGETKKIVWPGRHMVIKSTGIVLAAILVVGAGIWVIDFAISGAVTGINKAAENAQTTEAVSESEEASEDAEHDHDHDHEDEENSKAESAE